MPTLHLLCGLPGSGKSTLSGELAGTHPALRLVPDEWMSRIVGDGYDEAKRAVVEEIQWEVAEQALRLGVDVILESGSWSRRERDRIRARAAEIPATVRLHFLDVPRDELWRRLSARNALRPPHTFPVSEADLDRWVRGFEAPTPDELD